MGRNRWALLAVLLGMTVAMAGCFGGGGIVAQTGWVEGYIYVRAADADIETDIQTATYPKLVISDESSPPPGTYSLEGADVMIEGMSRVVTTARNGSFQLDNVPVGQHRLIISHREFKDYRTKSFMVYANSPTKIGEESYGIGYYIIIGVREYSDSFKAEIPHLADSANQIKGAHTDMTYVQDWLADDPHNSLKTHLGVMMFDPTGDEILNEIRGQARHLRPRDYMVIYFSGHAVKDAEWGDALVCHDRFLTDGELLDALEGAGSTDITLILDGCFTGSFADGTVTQPKAFLRTPYAILAAAQADSIAYEVDATDYGYVGLFTKHLIEALKAGTADRNRDGKVTVSEIYTATYQQIANETSDTRYYKGGPQKIFYNIGSNDPIIFKYWY